MTTQLDEHIICREKVCVACYRKARRINGREVRSVQDVLIESYRNDDLDFPSRICDGCHLLLEKKKIKEDTVLPQVDSCDPERPTLPRNSKCSCKICAVTKSTINSSLSKKKKTGRPKTKTTSDNASRLVVCSKCFSRIGKGYSHNCTRRGKVYNVENLLSKTPTTSERVASRIVQDLDNPQLQTLGPMPLSSVGKDPNTTNKRLFTVDGMSVIQRDLSLSNKKLKFWPEI